MKATERCVQVVKTLLPCWKTGVCICALICSVAFSAKGDLSAKSYILDGLIGHWDGLENVSYGGEHDNSAENWAELTGNGPSFLAPTDSVFVATGLQTVRAHGTKIARTAADNLLNAFTNANYTVEIAFNKTTETPYPSQGYKSRKICPMRLFAKRSSMRNLWSVVRRGQGL